MCIIWLFFCLFNSKYRRSIVGKFTSNKSYILKLLIYGIFLVGIPVIMTSCSLNSIPAYVISLFSPIIIFFIFLFNIFNGKYNNFKINFITKLIFWFGYAISLFCTDFWRIVLSSFEFRHYFMIITLYFSISLGISMISKLKENDDIFLSTLIQLIQFLLINLLQN